MSGLTSSSGSGICYTPMLNLTKNTGSGYVATTQAALPALIQSFPSLISVIISGNTGLCRTDVTYYHQ